MTTSGPVLTNLVTAMATALDTACFFHQSNNKIIKNNKMAYVAVTGANRGIGLAICKAFHDRGDIVYGVVRKTSSELTALGLKVRRACVRRRSVLEESVADSLCEAPTHAVGTSPALYCCWRAQHRTGLV